MARNKYVDFVSDEHFLKCVKYVCDGYPRHGKTADLNRNALDPVKAIFDMLNGGFSLSQWLKNEEIRQADKTLNNRIGEFHQMLLGGVNGWVNLGIGDESKVDLKKKDGTIFVEIKNKYNTVNSDSLAKLRFACKSPREAGSSGTYAS